MRSNSQPASDDRPVPADFRAVRKQTRTRRNCARGSPRLPPRLPRRQSDVTLPPASLAAAPASAIMSGLRFVRGRILVHLDVSRMSVQGSRSY